MTADDTKLTKQSTNEDWIISLWRILQSLFLIAI